MSTTTRGGGGLAHVRLIRAFWGCPSFWRCLHRLDLAFELRGGSGWHQDGDGPRAAASAERTTNTVRTRRGRSLDGQVTDASPRLLAFCVAVIFLLQNRLICTYQGIGG